MTSGSDSNIHPAATVETDTLNRGARMFSNRLRKNLRTMGKWAARAGIPCYRLYDADMPEYALAVDLYHGDRAWVHCQEYAAPRSVDPTAAAARLEEAMTAIPQALQVPKEQVFLKLRQRQRGKEQYQKLAQERRFHEVREGRCSFLVNFTDYLDTGLFLDHRLTRNLVGELAKGRAFLNLFAYTGTASIHAALGGAISTTSVDLSSTYLNWAERNLSLNGLDGPEHQVIQADCVAWLEQPGRSNTAEKYGLIFLDPPTFSRSKRMRGTFDVQRDHAGLIHRTMGLLEANGLLIFSNNFRRFRMEGEVMERFRVEDITARTIPRDFERNPRIHNCWLIRHRDAGPGLRESPS